MELVFVGRARCTLLYEQASRSPSSIFGRTAHSPGIKKALSHFRGLIYLIDKQQLATASREKTGQVRLVLDKRVGDAVTFALAIGVVRSA
jgi:hypothetical protein